MSFFTKASAVLLPDIHDFIGFEKIFRSKSIVQIINNDLYGVGKRNGFKDGQRNF